MSADWRATAPATKTLRVLLYNFNRDHEAKGSENVALADPRSGPTRAPMA